MSEINSFFIAGEVQAKQRPKFNGRFAYTPKETVSYENLVKLQYQAQCGNYRYPDDVPLIVAIFAHIEPPQSASNIKKTRMLNQAEYPLKKPDVDNVAKIILDALNGIAYRDDKQVVTLIVKKLYAGESGVGVTISEVEAKNE